MPPDDTERLEVTEDHQGARLDHFVTAVVPEMSRARVQRLIREGHVLLNGRTVRASHAVHAGDAVELEVPPAAPAVPAAEDLPLAVLHDDPDLVVVDKPAGMVVHPAAGHDRGTLVNALLHHVAGLSGIGGEQRPGIVHRLDRGTSGVMVVAKHDAAHTELSRQFADREVEKEYLGLAWGPAEPRAARIDAPLGRDPRRPEEDLDAGPPRPLRRHPHHRGGAAAGPDPRHHRHRHRPHPPDPRAPREHRPPYRRRRPLRRGAPPSGGRPPGPRVARAAVPPRVAPRVHARRATGGGWRSRRRFRRTCRRWWTTCGRAARARQRLASRNQWGLSSAGRCVRRRRGPGGRPGSPRARLRAWPCVRAGRRYHASPRRNRLSTPSNRFSSLSVRLMSSERSPREERDHQGGVSHCATTSIYGKPSTVQAVTARCRGPPGVAAVPRHRGPGGRRLEDPIEHPRRWWTRGGWSCRGGGRR